MQQRNQTQQVGRAQLGMMTTLLEYLTVLFGYPNPLNLFGRAQQTFGRAWSLPGPPLAMQLATFQAICSLN